jgi:hypothetical protein
MFSSIFITFTLFQFSVAHLNTGRLSILEKKTSSRPPVKRVKSKTRGPGRRKKPSAEEILQLDDDSEVELDSLGFLFMQLIDVDSSQEEAEASQADAAKVTIISSGLEPLPRKQIRRVVRKVKFSHLLAHLDPNFLLNKQQHG